MPPRSCPLIMTAQSCTSREDEPCIDPHQRTDKEGIVPGRRSHENLAEVLSGRGLVGPMRGRPLPFNAPLGCTARSCGSAKTADLPVTRAARFGSDTTHDAPLAGVVRLGIRRRALEEARLAAFLD